VLHLALGEEPRPGRPLGPDGAKGDGGLQGPRERLDAGHVVVRGWRGGREGRGRRGGLVVGGGGGGGGGELQQGRRAVLQRLSDGGQERPSAFHSARGKEQGGRR